MTAGLTDRGSNLGVQDSAGRFAQGVALIASDGSIIPTGSSGLDFSANQVTLPNVGAAFGVSGPYANYVLVKTIPAGSRALIDIENLSGTQIVVVRDDGTAANASPPVNASVFALSAGAAAGQQGASWVSTTFKGRVQIYAPSSAAQVTVMVD